MFYGSAGIYSFPMSYKVSGGNEEARIYGTRDAQAYYEYQGKMRYPEMITNFNVVGSHDYLVENVDVDTSISVGVYYPLSVSCGFSIGFDTNLSHEITYISMQESIRYEPK